jgi:hypothetical protein
MFRTHAQTTVESTQAEHVQLPSDLTTLVSEYIGGVDIHALVRGEMARIEANYGEHPSITYTDRAHGTVGLPTLQLQRDTDAVRRQVGRMSKEYRATYLRDLGTYCSMSDSEYLTNEDETACEEADLVRMYWVYERRLMLEKRGNATPYGHGLNISNVQYRRMLTNLCSITPKQINVPFMNAYARLYELTAQKNHEFEIQVGLDHIADENKFDTVCWLCTFFELGMYDIFACRNPVMWCAVRCNRLEEMLNVIGIREWDAFAQKLHHPLHSAFALACRRNQRDWAASMREMYDKMNVQRAKCSHAVPIEEERNLLIASSIRLADCSSVTALFDLWKVTTMSPPAMDAARNCDKQDTVKFLNLRFGTDIHGAGLNAL